jgi:hypothetical protein
MTIKNQLCYVNLIWLSSTNLNIWHIFGNVHVELLPLQLICFQVAFIRLLQSIALNAGRIDIQRQLAKHSFETLLGFDINWGQSMHVFQALYMYTGSRLGDVLWMSKKYAQIIQMLNPNCSVYASTSSSVYRLVRFLWGQSWF